MSEKKPQKRQEQLPSTPAERVELKAIVQAFSDRLDTLNRKIDEAGAKLDGFAEYIHQIAEVNTNTENIMRVMDQKTPQTLEPKTDTQTINKIKQLFPRNLEELLTFEEVGNDIIIRTRQFLGSENFAKILSIVRDAGGKYVSAGKQSHFKIPK